MRNEIAKLFKVLVLGSTLLLGTPGCGGSSSNDKQATTGDTGGSTGGTNTGGSTGGTNTGGTTVGGGGTVADAGTGEGGGGEGGGVCIWGGSPCPC